MPQSILSFKSHQLRWMSTTRSSVHSERRVTWRALFAAGDLRQQFGGVSMTKTLCQSTRSHRSRRLRPLSIPPSRIPTEHLCNSALSRTSSCDRQPCFWLALMNLSEGAILYPLLQSSGRALPTSGELWLPKLYHYLHRLDRQRGLAEYPCLSSFDSLGHLITLTQQISGINFLVWRPETGKKGVRCTVYANLPRGLPSSHILYRNWVLILIYKVIISNLKVFLTSMTYWSYLVHLLIRTLMWCQISFFDQNTYRK